MSPNKHTNHDLSAADLAMLDYIESKGLFLERQ